MDYSILNASNDFAELSNSVGKYKEDLSTKVGINISSQDERLVCYDTIQQYLLSLTAYIRAFWELQNKVSDPSEFLKILNIGINKASELEDSKIIYKFPIESLVTMIHFQIDSLFGEMCKQSGKPQTGFYKRMKCVLDSIEINEEKISEYQNNLQCLAFFRNSFHNRGKHTIDRRKWQNGVEPQAGEIDRVFSNAGQNIEFRHKKEIEYNWQSVFHLIERSVTVLHSLVLAHYLAK